MQSDDFLFSNSKVADIVRSFRRFHRELFHLLRLQADDLNTTPVQILTLRALAEHPDIHMGDLAEKLQLSCSTMSGVVKRLAEANLITRERLAEDQRTLTIRLTPKGRDLERQAFGGNSILARALGQLLEKIPEQDIHNLLATHQRMIAILQAEGEKKNNESSTSCFE